MNIVWCIKQMYTLQRKSHTIQVYLEKRASKTILVSQPLTQVTGAEIKAWYEVDSFMDGYQLPMLDSQKQSAV